MAWNFAAELASAGPTATARPSLAEARAYCAYATRSHYENFTVASWLLPRKLVPHFHAVYAWCRWADDLADETAGGSESLALLDWWNGELEACFAGEPRHPVTVALHETVQRFGIPFDLFRDLLSAFRQDQTTTDYDTFGQLVDYCRRSADPVGRLVLYLFEHHKPECLEPSDAVCTGLQLANFWQDVARDRAKGRIYIPKEDRSRFGVQPATWHAQPAAMRDLIRFQVARTHEWFDRGESLLRLLPRTARIDVALFLRGGRAVLRAIERQNHDVLTSRPSIGKAEKLMLLLRTLLG